jgi:hypothetical protein
MPKLGNVGTERSMTKSLKIAIAEGLPPQTLFRSRSFKRALMGQPAGERKAWADLDDPGREIHHTFLSWDETALLLTTLR